MRHFVLPGKNAVLQPPLENFQIRQTMCDTLFVKFSNMATNQVTACESSCPHYSYSHIEGLGLHVVYITHCVKNYKKQFSLIKLK